MHRLRRDYCRHRRLNDDCARRVLGLAPIATRRQRRACQRSKTDRQHGPTHPILQTPPNSDDHEGYTILRVFPLSLRDSSYTNNLNLTGKALDLSSLSGIGVAQLLGRLPAEGQMIQGMVNATYEAVIPLTLQGPAGQTQDIEAVVDTGYSGFLTLPTGLVTELSLPFAYIGQAFLANDDEVNFDVHDVTVLWDGQPRPIKADATGSTPLVGMLLLDRHDLSIQIRTGGRVIIQAGE